MESCRYGLKWIFIDRKAYTSVLIKGNNCIIIHFKLKVTYLSSIMYPVEFVLIEIQEGYHIKLHGLFKRF